MKFNILTLFPEMFEPLNQSILKRAKENGIIQTNIINIRDYSEDKHKHVDDTPYGGGAGMVIKPDVVYNAYNSLENKKAKVIYMSPQGKVLDQRKVLELAKAEELTILCGHYEGIDQRVLDEIVDEEISIGNYEESFSKNNLLEYPQYTRPYEFMERKIPDVLISGNHQKIDEWRKQQSLINTYKKRPELLTSEQKKLIDFESWNQI